MWLNAEITKEYDSITIHKESKLLDDKKFSVYKIILQINLITKNIEEF